MTEVQLDADDFGYLVSWEVEGGERGGRGGGFRSGRQELGCIEEAQTSTMRMVSNLK